MMRRRLWLGDLARLKGNIDNHELARVAFSVGFVLLPTPPDPVAPPDEPAPRVMSAQPVVPLGPVRFFRAESAWFVSALKDDGSEVVPTWVPEPLPEPPSGSLLNVPRTPNAESWSSRWPRIRSLLRVKARGRAPDLPQTVKLVAKARVLTRVPRVKRYKWPERVELWLDGASRNVPLFEDQNRLVARVRRVVGPRRVQARLIDHATQEAAAYEGGHLLPRAFGWGRRRVLVLGDLGTWGTRDVRAAWERTAIELRRRGIAPRALVPTGRAISPRWQVAPWERPTSNFGTHQREFLLILVSMAGLLEPGLLRAIRLAWRHAGLSLTTEYELLEHDAVRRYDCTAILLHRDERESYRRRFATLSHEDQARLVAILRRWHAGLPGEVSYSETIALSRYGWRPATKSDKRHMKAAKRFVRSLADHLHPWRHDASPEVESWRRWALKISESVPPEYFRQRPLGPTLLQLKEHAKFMVRHDLEENDQPRPLDVRQVGSEPRHGRALPFNLRADDKGSNAGSFLGSVMTAAGSLTVAQEDDEFEFVELDAGEEAPFDGQLSWVVRTPFQRLHLRAWERPAWAKEAGHDRIGLWVTIEVSGVPYRLRWIPPGRYLRGSPESEQGRHPNEGPRHSVVISRGFWLGQTPVTGALWEVVTGRSLAPERSADAPIESVSWHEAKAFCQELGSKLPGLAPRLPSEAEWEYACRAGTQTATWLGDLSNLDSETTVQRIGWYAGNENRSGGPRTTKAVGLLEPNPWGLYDMLGNVFEWCEDRTETLKDYHSDPLEDPVGTEGQSRVVRGGSWSSPAYLLRAAYRDAANAHLCVDNLGFRVAGGPPLPDATSNLDGAIAQEDAPRRAGRFRAHPLSRAGTLNWASQRGDDEYGPYVVLELGGNAYRMRWIRPGSYIRGSSPGEPGSFTREHSQQTVKLTRGFWLGEVPVTQSFFSSVMGSNPSRFVHPQRPVEMVSWLDAQRFCQRLAELVPSFLPRLPTEAEWEYACRAGTTTGTWVGDLQILGANHAPQLDSIAVYGGNSGVNFELLEFVDSTKWHEKHHPHTRAGTAKVATKQPNPWGLYDMLGNVWEWCEDTTDLKPYSREPAINPLGRKGTQHAVRGGSWHDQARLLRAAFRNANGTKPGDDLGFRLAAGALPATR